MKLILTFTIAIAIFLMAIVSTSQAEDDAESGVSINTFDIPRAERKSLIGQEFFKKAKKFANLHGHGHGHGHGRGNRKRCMCPFIVKFVCGSDNVTYSNECHLKCQGKVEKAHDGSCEDPNKHTEASRSDDELAATDVSEVSEPGESGTEEGGPEDGAPEQPLPEPTAEDGPQDVAPEEPLPEPMTDGGPEDAAPEEPLPEPTA